MGTAAVRDSAEDTLRVSAEDSYGVLTVTVGEAGALGTVDIAETAYQHYTPGELSAAIERTYQDAVDKQREDVVAHFYGLCGIEVSPAEAAGNHSRLDNLINKLARRPALNSGLFA